MKHCPVCGCFSSTNEQRCSNPDCSVIEKTLHKMTGGQSGDDKGPEMLQTTTENRFCCYCNIVLAPKKRTCPKCGKATAQMTDSHLRSKTLLLSGTGAQAVWEVQ